MADQKVINNRTPLEPGAQPDEHRRVAAHGDPGSGKTSWASTIITPRTLALDCGGGLGVLSHLLKPSQVIRLFDPADLTRMDQDDLIAQTALNFERAFEYVKSHVPDWLIIDNLNTVVQGLETAGRLDMKRGKAYLSEGSGKPDVFALYGDLANAQFRVIDKSIKLPCNLYLTITSELEYEKEWVFDPRTGREVSKMTGKKWASPALVGKKIIEPFMAAFDAVLYFHTKREAVIEAGKPQRVVTKYLVRTRPTDTVRAKIRQVKEPIPDVLSIGQIDQQGVISIGQADYTLARLVRAMGGTAIANEIK